MEYTFHLNPSRVFGTFTKDKYDQIQDEQNCDFKRCWEKIHPDIGLIYLCGNHNVGNRLTPSSVQNFKNAFGDDYLDFWYNRTCNVVLNNILFSNPTGEPDLFESQIRWLEGRLDYVSKHGASQLFVFGNHSWFLYHEDEDSQDLDGTSASPPKWYPPEGTQGFPDSYFHINKTYRQVALDLFRQYGVDACFVEHFHQNLISRTEWGM